ncbi:MAG TPA: OmpA family protein [Polyangia bacterium]
MGCLVLGLVTGFAPPTMAQTEDPHIRTDVGIKNYRFELGVLGGWQYFDDEHGIGRADIDDPELSPAQHALFGLNFTFNLNQYIAFEAEGLATRTHTRNDLTNLWLFQLGGHVLVQPWQTRVRPFLSLGYGGMASVVSDEVVLPNDQDGFGRLGLGIKVALGSRVNLRVEGRVQSSLAFASDLVEWGNETGYGGPDFAGLIGLSFNLGEQRAKLYVADKVVYTPPPTEDPDKDGLSTRADRCPDVAEDADGFQDDDGCPEVDNDNDGIADIDDKCPLKPEDKNGIDDSDGCPDTDDDNDGVLGTKDQCPDKPETKNGFKDDDGCPDELPAEVKKFTGVIEGINFKLKSASLLKNSLPVLDRAVEVLKTYPEVRLEISGHTDNRGKADFNRDLSQKRAESVRDYLITKGIAAERLVAIGYGMDRPIADNKTTGGRGRNRRTEFRILTAE